MEVVVIREFGNLHIVAPAAVGSAVLGNVGGYYRGGAFRESVVVARIVRTDGLRRLFRCSRLRLVPRFSYLFQCFKGIVVYLSVSVRSYIQDEIAMRFSHRDNVPVYQEIRALESGGRERRLPEPVLLERVAGEGRKCVACLVDFLPGALFIRLDVSVEESV